MSPSPGKRVLGKIFKEGRSFWGPFFTARWHPFVALDRPVVIVNQKVSKKATVRNRIRRRLKALLKDFPQKGLVVLGKRLVAEAPFTALKNEVVRLKRRVGEDGQDYRQSN